MRCASCFDELRPATLGGHYACEKCPRGSGYLSPHAPEGQHTQKACVVSKHGRPTLHYYGRGWW